MLSAFVSLQGEMKELKERSKWGPFYFIRQMFRRSDADVFADADDDDDLDVDLDVDDDDDLIQQMLCRAAVDAVPDTVQDVLF